MRHHHHLVVAVACAVVALPSCLLLNRAAELTPGSVRGTARFSGEGRDDVAVVLSNSGFSQRSAGGGDFLIEGLSGGNHGLRLQEDDDNDGIVDRGAVVGFVLGEFNGGFDGVDLGPVAMRGTVTVSGTIVDEDGGGLDGLVVLVSRFSLDHTAEVLVPLTDEDGDGNVSFSLRGVVPGAIEVQAIARGGRASDAFAFTLSDDANTDNVALAVRGVPVVAVNTTVTPPLPSARFAIVAPDSGPNAAQVAGGNVGVDVSVEAGVYDVWFFEGDSTVPIAFLPRQVARDIDLDSTAPLVWGPAIRGPASGVTGDENTAPTLTTTTSETRLLLTRDPIINDANIENGHRLAFTVADPDGDEVIVTAVQPTTTPVEVFVNDDNTVGVRLRDDATAENIADAIFSRTPIQLSLDDGRGEPVIITVGTAVLADAVFVGRTGLPDDEGALMLNEENWLAGRFADSASPRDVVFEARAIAIDQVNFHDVQLRAPVELADAAFTCGSIFSGAADAVISGDGVIELEGTIDDPAVLGVDVVDVSVSVEGYASFGSNIDISGEATVTFFGAATLHQFTNVQNVFIRVPFTLDSAARFEADAGAVVHFAADVVLDGTVGFDVEAGMAFGVPGTPSTFTLSGSGFNQGLGTASFAGAGGTITINTNLFAPTGFKVFDAVTVSMTGQQFLGEVTTTSIEVVAPSTIVDGRFTLGALREADFECAATGTIGGSILLTSRLQLTDKLVVDSLSVATGAVLRFGPGTSLTTSELAVDGTVDLAGDGVLELRGIDDTVQFNETATVASSGARGHQTTFTAAGPATISAGTFIPVVLDVVRVGPELALNVSGDFTVQALILDDNASVEARGAFVVIDTCSGAGAPAGCPNP